MKIADFQCAENNIFGVLASRRCLDLKIQLWFIFNVPVIYCKTIPARFVRKAPVLPSVTGVAADVAQRGVWHGNQCACHVHGQEPCCARRQNGGSCQGSCQGRCHGRPWSGVGLQGLQDLPLRRCQAVWKNQDRRVHDRSGRQGQGAPRRPLQDWPWVGSRKTKTKTTDPGRNLGPWFAFFSNGLRRWVAVVGRRAL